MTKSKAPQEHGNMFENQIHLATHGILKDDYQKLIPNGYTSKYDIVKGTHSKKNVSIKVTGNNGVGCGDIMRMYEATSNDTFDILIGTWTQKGNNKHYSEIYEIKIKPEYHNILWGGMKKNKIKEFVDYVKSIPHGKKAQLENQPIWKEKRKVLEKNKGIIDVAAKIDSGGQRRTQCGFGIKQLIDSGIPYKRHTKDFMGIQLPYIQKNAKPRTFKKKHA